MTTPSAPGTFANRSLRVLAVVGSLAAMFGVFLGVVRPWYQHWGATDAEVRGALPGDELVPRAVFQETRAITIHAPVERVWPWVAQLGQDRGGFYSFDVLENLVGCNMPTHDRLRPDRQSWRVGDRLWMYPQDKGGGQGFATLRIYVPGRALGFIAHAPKPGGRASEDGSWVLVLAPIDESTTRLLVRGRSAGDRSGLGVAFDRLVFEPMHFVMERRMMIGIRQLAEDSDRGRQANHVHVFLWVVAFGLCVAALAGVLWRERWHQALLAFVLAGSGFAFLTLVQPPLALGAGLVTLLTVLLWTPVSVRRSAAWAGRHRHDRSMIHAR